MNGRERFLAACRCKPVDRTPVWFMRQAGRYLPEYRALRKTHSILTLAKTPHLAAEVAMQPLRVLDVDAAILFADIVLPLQAMGVDVDLPDNVGPVVARPVRTSADVDALDSVNPRDDLDYVMDAIQRLCDELRGERALVGFSGAPFTLGSYLIEGRPSRDFTETKQFMHAQPLAWKLLMEKLSTVVADYLRAQVDAGADAVQLFDSWAGHLSPDDYGRFVAPYSARVLSAVKETGAPSIHFATPASGILGQVRDAGGDVVGVDWRIRIDDAWRRLGPEVAIQGNLDPAVLSASWESTQEAARQILRAAGGRPGHVFNLGHGILPSTPVSHAQRLVDLVHAESTRRLEEATP